MKSTPKVDIRAAVLSAMQAQGVTQRAIAERTGIPQPSLSRWLSGARSSVNTVTAERVMAALRLRVVSSV